LEIPLSALETESRSPMATIDAPDANDSPAARYVDADNVSLGYPTRGGGVNLACEDISFRIRRGEFIVIVGPSGCGKTTMLEALAGLVPVAYGEIRVAGNVITRPGPERSLVFQSPSLFPWRDVRSNVLFGLQAQRSMSKDGVRRADELIELVGLTAAAHKSPRELSGGMKQRVNLARALVTRPELLLLDEPFGALDAQTRDVMQQELLRIWQDVDKHQDEPMTAVFVTHDVQEAVYLADRILVFSNAPAAISADIRVPFARPRNVGIKKTPEFIALQDRVLNLIHGTSTETQVELPNGEKGMA
jgi:NitT/TauT family transport system ATP-binding protein